jgi:hypothetical protein
MAAQMKRKEDDKIFNRRFFDSAERQDSITKNTLYI